MQIGMSYDEFYEKKLYYVLDKLSHLVEVYNANQKIKYDDIDFLAHRTAHYFDIVLDSPIGVYGMTDAKTLKTLQKHQLPKEPYSTKTKKVEDTPEMAEKRHDINESIREHNIRIQNMLNAKQPK